jgi:hypothetical protein
MALLQRRFASSVYAVRRTLERMKEKREKNLAAPQAFRQEQITRKLPEDFEDLPEEEREEIIAQLEDVVASVDPGSLREEIAQLEKLVAQACEVEEREIERKLVVLKDVLAKRGVFSDPKMKLLLFTEHKDTLDFLAGDGKEGRPLGKLLKWGLLVTQIYGGMKIGDRDTPRGHPLGRDNDPELYVRGTLTYRAQLNPENPVGTIQSIEHVLRNLDRRAEDERQELQRQGKALGEYKGQLDRPFEHEQRLRELLVKQAQLNAALDLDKNERQVAPDDPQTEKDAMPSTFVERTQSAHTSEMTM